MKPLLVQQIREGCVIDRLILTEYAPRKPSRGVDLLGRESSGIGFLPINEFLEEDNWIVTEIEEYEVTAYLLRYQKTRKK
jgi:hypothetical protein